MAEDQVQVMNSLGFDRFRVAGHDRGGRVAHRMALDHSARIVQWAVLDIVPTRTMYLRTDRVFAEAYYHWFFLIQPAPFPERLIGADPALFLTTHLSGRHAGLGAFDREALAEYRTAFRSSACIHATCEDYRAAATIGASSQSRTGRNGWCRSRAGRSSVVTTWPRKHRRKPPRSCDGSSAPRVQRMAWPSTRPSSGSVGLTWRTAASVGAISTVRTNPG